MKFSLISLYIPIRVETSHPSWRYLLPYLSDEAEIFSENRGFFVRDSCVDNSIEIRVADEDSDTV